MAGDPSARYIPRSAEESRNSPLGGTIALRTCCPKGKPVKRIPAKPHVALVTCEEFSDLYADDLLLVSALEEIDVSAVPAVWSRADIDWTSFDALVMRSPWDYFKRAAE